MQLDVLIVFCVNEKLTEINCITQMMTDRTRVSPSANDDFIVMGHKEKVGNPLRLESLA